jgi:hypothetical protein
MKLAQKLSLIVIGFMVQSLALAHEGLHASGQAHIGESHMGLFEISLAVIAICGLSVYLFKNKKH